MSDSPHEDSEATRIISRLVEERMRALSLEREPYDGFILMHDGQVRALRQRDLLQE